MKPEIPPELLKQSAEWDRLHRWERRKLGKALRRHGLTYTEIRELIPVPKATLSNWCSSVSLTPEQIQAIRDRVPSQLGVPKDSQWRRRLEIERIRSEASAYAVAHLDDPLFVAGVVLYWAEGSKSRNDVILANTDARTLRLFVTWARRYLDRNAEFVLSLHLHEGNDEEAAQSYWRAATRLSDVQFTKTYTKPRGTGHRKNRLEQGVCRLRVRRSADHWNRIMTWIETVADSMGS
jgi:hypothetical protein